LNALREIKTCEGGPIAESLAGKVLEAIERSDHLVSLVTDDLLEWAPATPDSVRVPMSTGQLLGHLLDCLAGFCACFAKIFPETLDEAGNLRDLEVNHSCGPAEARQRIEQYREQIVRGFAMCTDADLARVIPTVFVPAGESLTTLLLGNLEHLLNHKYQLFTYLKLRGMAVSTRDLYRLRCENTEARSQ
jgi:hypothetical protein